MIHSVEEWLKLSRTRSMQDRSRADDPTWRPTTAANIETNEVPDGYVVYQPAVDRVHYLNHTAAILLELCNGKNQVGEMPELLRLAFGLSAPPVEEVRDCLDQLIREGLVT
jgi:hypothetical protein